MPGDLGRSAIIRNMQPLADDDIVAVVDELFLPLVHYYEQRFRSKGRETGDIRESARIR